MVFIFLNHRLLKFVMRILNYVHYTRNSFFLSSCSLYSSSYDAFRSREKHTLNTGNLKPRRKLQSIVDILLVEYNKCLNFFFDAIPLKITWINFVIAFLLQLPTQNVNRVWRMLIFTFYGDFTHYQAREDYSADVKRKS